MLGGDVDHLPVHGKLTAKIDSKNLETFEEIWQCCAIQVDLCC